MNLHPMVVHFPIALLVTYGIFELIPLKKITKQPYWKYTKAILLLVGVFTSFFALQTGEMIEHNFRGLPEEKIMEVHSAFAFATVWIFVLLLVGYLIFLLRESGMCENWEKRHGKKFGKLSIMLKWAYKLEYVLIGSPVKYFLVIAGLAGMTITGALGAAIVYGPEIDPAVKLIYSFFF